jgi:hypothetical protein
MSIWKVDKWNYRITSKRSILVKNKDKDQHKVVAVDLATKLPFVLEVPKDVSMQTINAGKEYLVTLRIYTAKSTENVSADYIELFQVLDVDRPAENFLSATCCYPDLVRFELEDIET